MTNIHIVVEGEMDAQILKWLLPKLLVEYVQFWIGGGRYGAQSLASSLIAKRQEPIALILDADSQNPSEIAEKREFSTSLVRSVASGTPYKVLSAIPEIEEILLQYRPLIERVAQKHFTELEWELARYNPKLFLKETIGGSAVQTLLNAATAEDVAELQQHPLIRELTDFLAAVIKENA